MSSDPREVQWRQHEAAQLAVGRCPYSGLGLRRDGNASAVSDLSCDVCDCFGYAAGEVGGA